ncbi:unnamed protein product [Fraxinus pennsylvanica]|uniref:Uncharacterized protein n=1 Tax=Fraxinus pennsylvanica TaxID=56036 RepID=A0AAD2DYM1_9LAMI|nr:unnamed protein product [Fraxinus pennsylvanica]
MIMKKRALWTTMSMKMETPSPAKKSKAKIYSTTAGMGLQQSRKWWWFWVLEMAAAFERGKKYRAAALSQAFCAGKKICTVSIILVIKLLNFAETGKLVSCGSVSLESSYEKVSPCVYSSTLLYEFGEPGLRPSDVRNSCFNWRLAYAERFSTDFYVTDSKSGIRALVKAGPDCKVFPLIIESKLVKTTQKCRVLSSHLRKWLRDRNLPAEARVLRLEEGYIKEGSSVSVLGLLHRNNDVVMIVQPQDVISTGCLWQKLLLPVDIDGLVIGVPERADPLTPTNSTPCQH